jgi:enolase
MSTSASSLFTDALLLLMLDCRSGDELIDVYKSFIAEFPVVTIEDPFDQDDWAHYTKLTAAVGTTQVPRP